MVFEGITIDDVMHQVFTELLASPIEIRQASTNFYELVGASIILSNPRARLSRSETRGKSISTIGEFLWHMSAKGNVKFISHYIRNYHNYDKSMIGAYGPKLFSFQNEFNQVERVIEQLRTNAKTRNAVIQIFDVNDLSSGTQGACTLSLQFLIRDGKLVLIVTMRSNDAYLGMPHDIFSFTMLHELIANEVEADLGFYIHNVGSLHLYEHNVESAKTYLDEGIQATKPMPNMPKINPFAGINWLLEIENKIRNEEVSEINENSGIDGFWIDLARMLLLLNHSRNNRKESCLEIHDSFQSEFFKPYCMDIINRLS